MSNVDLILGDCFDVMKKLPDNSIDLVVTDPPYWHNKGHGAPTIGDDTILNSELYDADGKMYSQMSDFNPQSMILFLNSIKRVMKLMNCYIFCNDSQVSTYGKWAEENNYHFSILVWRKPLSIINTNRYSQNVEFICRIYQHGTGLNFVNNKDYYDRVITDPIVRGNNKVHPTEKPISICERLVLLSSKEGDVVLDPFMGSGSTGVACKLRNRNFIGIEKDEKYFNIAKNRLGEVSSIDDSKSVKVGLW